MEIRKSISTSTWIWEKRAEFRAKLWKFVIIGLECHDNLELLTKRIPIC